MDFLNVVKKSRCIFADPTNITVYNEWNTVLTWNQNIHLFGKNFKDYTKTSQSLGSDGLAVYIPMSFKEIEPLVYFFKRFLFSLEKYNAGHSSLIDCNIEKEGWKYTFDDMVFHILVFARCYGRHHARHTFGDKNTYILFQPSHSFLRRRESNGLISEKKKVVIRKRFIENDQFYNVDLSKSEKTALKFIKPMHLDQDPIRWWL